MPNEGKTITDFQRDFISALAEFSQVLHDASECSKMRAYDSPDDHKIKSHIREYLAQLAEGSRQILEAHDNRPEDPTGSLLFGGSIMGTVTSHVRDLPGVVKLMTRELDRKVGSDYRGDDRLLLQPLADESAAYHVEKIEGAFAEFATTIKSAMQELGGFDQ